jgi:hypothetical protein
MGKRETARKAVVLLLLADTTRSSSRYKISARTVPLSGTTPSDGFGSFDVTDNRWA